MESLFIIFMILFHVLWILSICLLIFILINGDAYFTEGFKKNIIKNIKYDIRNKCLSSKNLNRYKKLLRKGKKEYGVFVRYIPSKFFSKESYFFRECDILIEEYEKKLTNIN